MSGTLGPWADARLTASWRGIPFRVRESELRFGRRQALHEYPFRDTVWVEDLGQASRVIAFRGFLVGDDVDDRLRDMLEAAETAGDGTLVHPVLGNLTASLFEPLVARDTMEQGRVWSLDFVFIAGAERVFPNAAADTQDAVSSAASDATMAVAGSFASVGDTLQGVASTVSTGIADAQQVISGVRSTVSGFVGTVKGLAQDVGTVASLAGLGGNYGRFSLGARLASIPGLTNATTALLQANAAAAAVGRIGNTVNSLAAQI